jgi:5'-3' exoribonuclease 1
MISDATLLPEFDNLYLDMNGIIHACSHPNDDDTTSLSQREMMLAIFRYIDRIVTEIVKPKKVLFMAIDGVAPRAKLNQQVSYIQYIHTLCILLLYYYILSILVLL